MLLTCQHAKHGVEINSLLPSTRSTPPAHRRTCCTSSFSHVFIVYDNTQFLSLLGPFETIILHFVAVLIKFLSDRVVKAARSVYSVMIEKNPGLIRDRKYHLKTYRYQHYRDVHTDNGKQTTRVNVPTRQCCSGKELVDWLMKQSDCLQSRSQVVGMWQVLVDEGILVHGKT